MAAVNTRFSIAVHLMSGLGYGGKECGGNHTSGELSHSVNACPSFVRRVVSRLAKAGLVHTTRGKSGTCALARPAKEITLLDIHRAVDAPKPFALHDYPPQEDCIVSCNIRAVLEDIQETTRKAFEATLKAITLADVLSGLGKR